MLFAPMAAADELRGALYENVYSIRPGYSEEAAAIARHAEALGARRLAIVHATDHESLAALDAATRTMTAMGSNLVSSVELKKKAGGPSPIDKVLAARPESILVIGTATEAAQAVRQLRASGFRGSVYGFSNTGESLLADELGAAGGGVVIVRVVPKSDALKIPVVRDLIADASAA
jgi:ABC-type branched-subunit amino acid transport system substrate-binding protein